MVVVVVAVELQAEKEAVAVELQTEKEAVPADLQPEKVAVAVAVLYHPLRLVA